MNEQLVEQIKTVLYGTKIDKFNRDDDGLDGPQFGRTDLEKASRNVLEDVLSAIQEAEDKTRDMKDTIRQNKQLLKECRKVMKANSLFRNTEEHRNLNLRLKEATRN